MTITPLIVGQVHNARQMRHESGLGHGPINDRIHPESGRNVICRSAWSPTSSSQRQSPTNLTPRHRHRVGNSTPAALFRRVWTIFLALLIRIETTKVDHVSKSNLRVIQQGRQQ